MHSVSRRDNEEKRRKSEVIKQWRDLNWFSSRCLDIASMRGMAISEFRGDFVKLANFKWSSHKTYVAKILNFAQSLSPRNEASSRQFWAIGDEDDQWINLHKITDTSDLNDDPRAQSRPKIVEESPLGRLLRRLANGRASSDLYRINQIANNFFVDLESEFLFSDRQHEFIGIELIEGLIKP